MVIASPSQEPAAASPGPIRVVEVELGEALPRIDNPEGRYERVWVVARLHTTALGMIELTLPRNGIDAEALARNLWWVLERQIRAHLNADGLHEHDALPPGGLAGPGLPLCLQERQEALRDEPLVSVVLATRDRPDALRTALHALRDLDYPRVEIVVVDNAPGTPSTASVVAEFAGVRYVPEPRPGLSWARNRGVMEARGDIIAFTDDDIVVDRHWVSALVQAFGSGTRVGCVTGLVLPYELETAPQIWFEQYGGFTKGFKPQIFDLAYPPPDRPTFPYSIGMVGPMMACRRSLLLELGGFDPALGAGSPSAGGEDLRLLFEVLAAGYQVVYNPSAIEYHCHRRDYSALHRQVHAYGSGFVAFLLSLLVHRPHLVLSASFLRRLPLGIVYLFSRDSAKNGKKEVNFPRELTSVELRGFLAGPLAYVRGTTRARRIARQFGPLDVAAARNLK